MRLCNSCEVLSINGVKCHEQGCPDSWRDEVHECKWCGTEFIPDLPFQKFCCDDCAESYYN